MKKEAFKRVILYARQHRANQDVYETILKLLEFLTQHAVEVYLAEETEQSFALNHNILSRNQMDERTDLILVVGGDGSLLSAARMAVTVNVPVVGVNRGRLGFLTDISPKTIENHLRAILNGEYIEESRFLLHMKIHDDSKTYFESCALNDVVLSRGTETHLIEFDVDIDQQFVSHYRSDGLIVATPTGSTAYALSAGGPIMHPGLDAIVLVPMFSHSLSSRPLVVDGDAKIELKISKSNEHSLQMSCDGHESSCVEPGQQVSISKFHQCLRLLHPADYHYYDTLRIKLGWGFKPQG